MCLCDVELGLRQKGRGLCFIGLLFCFVSLDNEPFKGAVGFVNDVGMPHSVM